MLSKLGMNPSFKGRIAVDPIYLNKEETLETVSKALTPQLKQRIEKELPEDWVIEFNSTDFCKLKTSDSYNPKLSGFVGLYEHKGSLPVKEFVRNYVNKILKIHENFQDRKYTDNLHQLSLLYSNYSQQNIKKYFDSMNKK